MPKMDGEQCLAALRAIDPQVPVVIATGYSVDDATRQRLEPEIAGFLTKPFDIPQILHGVEAALS